MNQAQKFKVEMLRVKFGIAIALLIDAVGGQFVPLSVTLIDVTKVGQIIKANRQLSRRL